MSHFIYHDLGRIEYEKALERQTAAFNTLLEAKAQGRTGENRLFFCEHQPVLTIGKIGKEYFYYSLLKISSRGAVRKQLRAS